MYLILTYIHLESIFPNPALLSNKTGVEFLSTPIYIADDILRARAPSAMPCCNLFPLSLPIIGIQNQIRFTLFLILALHLPSLSIYSSPYSESRLKGPPRGVLVWQTLTVLYLSRLNVNLSSIRNRNPTDLKSYINKE